jgi:hypothetical protein
MLYSVLKLRLKQVLGSFASGALFKFLAPDLLAGIMMALSIGNRADASFAARVGVVACGIALFTLIVETRKLFFTGGDVEDFYFVQPTRISRFASFSTIIILDLVVVLIAVIPSVLLVSFDTELLARILSASVLAVCFSTGIYLVVLFLISSLPKRVANSSLTITQILMALILLAMFQLPSVTENSFQVNSTQLIYGTLLLVSGILFFVFPIQEKLVAMLREDGSASNTNLVLATERLKKVVFMRSSEEEAGFLLFLSNIFRGRSFRLSTIGTAATPVMVSVYWALRGFHFVRFDMSGELPTSGFVAPIASLVTTGILVHYFLSQSLLGSIDHDAVWVFDTAPKFSFGKFVRGVRKSLLVAVQVPMTIAIFIVIIQRDNLVESTLTALTFYALTDIAACFFSIMQKNLPFTLPFTQFRSGGVIDLIFVLIYSFIATFALSVSYGNIGKLLMLILFAFILVGIIEFVSPGIIDKRMRLNV